MAGGPPRVYIYIWLGSHPGGMHVYTWPGAHPGIYMCIYMCVRVAGGSPRVCLYIYMHDSPEIYVLWPGSPGSPSEYIGSVMEQASRLHGSGHTYAMADFLHPGLTNPCVCFCHLVQFAGAGPFRRHGEHSGGLRLPWGPDAGGGYRHAGESARPA